MANRKSGRDAASLKRGQRVSRKSSDESGDVTESGSAGVKVKWDTGRTSYYRRDEEANVRRSTAPVRSLIVCPVCDREMRLLGIERESDVRDLFTFECEACIRFEVRGVRVT
jgi:hypothetical protein